MIVWIWDASGCDRRLLGVCCARDLAQEAVESELLSGQATFGSIEMAWVRFGIPWSYERSGQGETAVLNRCSGLPVWTPFRVRQKAS